MIKLQVTGLTSLDISDNRIQTFSHRYWKGVFIKLKWEVFDKIKQIYCNYDRWYLNFYVCPVLHAPLLRMSCPLIVLSNVCRPVFSLSSIRLSYPMCVLSSLCFDLRLSGPMYLLSLVCPVQCWSSPNSYICPVLRVPCLAFFLSFVCPVLRCPVQCI